MADYTAGFERWWSSYPSYKKKGKGAAFKSWKRDKLESKADDLRIILERQVENDEHFRQYTPMPSTYLNQSRYDDDVPKPKRPPIHARVPDEPEFVQDKYLRAVKKVAVNWLMRRHKPMTDDQERLTLDLIHVLADDARKLHERGELTDDYARVIRDELNGICT